MKYGPTFLEAICIFLRDLSIAQIIRHQRKLDGICNLESAECHFEQAAAVRREVANNSEVLNSFRTPLQMAMDRLLGDCILSR
jgi:hypothetical protein